MVQSNNNWEQHEGRKVGLPEHSGEVGDLQSGRVVELRVGGQVQAAHPRPQKHNLLMRMSECKVLRTKFQCNDKLAIVKMHTQCKLSI